MHPVCSSSAACRQDFACAKSLCAWLPFPATIKRTYCGMDFHGTTAGLREQVSSVSATRRRLPIHPSEGHPYVEHSPRYQPTCEGCVPESCVSRWQGSQNSMGCLPDVLKTTSELGSVSQGMQPAILDKHRHEREIQNLESTLLKLRDEVNLPNATLTRCLDQ